MSDEDKEPIHLPTGLPPGVRMTEIEDALVFMNEKLDKHSKLITVSFAGIGLVGLLATLEGKLLVDLVKGMKEIGTFMQQFSVPSIPNSAPDEAPGTKQTVKNPHVQKVSTEVESDVAPGYDPPEQAVSEKVAQQVLADDPAAFLADPSNLE